MVNPLPSIAVDGAFLQCFPITDTNTGKTVFPIDRPTLVGDMTIAWGRDNVWDQPDPSVLTLTMWEPQPGEWLRKVVEKKAIRRGVLVSFRRQDGAVDKDVIIFQGFTTNVDVQASQQLTDSGMTDGWMVQIQATDRSGFLGQENWGAQVLPEQSMQERAVRIRNQAAPTGIRQFYFEDNFKSGIVGAMDVTDKTVLDMVTGMYTSFADQWTYIPARNVVNRIPGGSNFQPYTLLLGVTYLAGSSVKLYPPTWGDPTGKEDPIDTAAYPTAYIGACDVTGGIALSSNMIQDITHISCKWYNKPGGAWHVTTLTVKDETPRSRLEFESWYNDGTFVDPILEDVRRTVVQDGGIPPHPRLTWDTAKSQDVPDWNTFESLTMAAQTIRMVALAGDPFAYALGRAPVWHPGGGVVGYRSGKWFFELDLLPTVMPLPDNFVPITPAMINKSITLANPDRWHIDNSITPYDMRFVPNDGQVYNLR
jgi:hypothetical protein